MYVELNEYCVNLQEHFWSLDESVEKLTPRLMVQIWDNDLGFANDDFLGAYSKQEYLLILNLFLNEIGERKSLKNTHIKDKEQL